MNDLYERVIKAKKIWRQSLTDGKRVFWIAVPIEVEYWRIDGKLEECLPPEASRLIEAAIEKEYPGWFHRILKGGKHEEGCPACKRKKRLTKKKSSI